MQSTEASVGARVMQVVDEKVLPRRYIVLALFGAVFAIVWLDLNNASGGDWHSFVQAARLFRTTPVDGDVATPVMLVVAYPFTVLSVSTGWRVASALCVGLGLLTIRFVEQAAEVAAFVTRRDRQRAVLFGGMFLMYAWALPGARWGHLDDVIAMSCLALACRALVSGRWLMASFAVAVAIDAKPWVVLALPLAACCTGARVRGLAVAGAAALVPWIPFAIAQHGHLGSLNLLVAPDSGLHYLGARIGSSPGWQRQLEVAVALPLGAYAVVKNKWYLVPAIAFAVRINLDPATFAYYVTGPILGLLIWDVVRPMRVPGLRTVLGCIALALVPSYLLRWNGYGATAPYVAVLRLAAAVPPIAVLFGLTPTLVRRVWTAPSGGLLE